MPHTSECVDCGEHNPGRNCKGCDDFMCEDCWWATGGYCDGCLADMEDEDNWDDDDEY